MKYYEGTNNGTPHASKRLIEWEQTPIKSFGEAQVDATGWRPDAELARAAILSGKGMSMQGVYDFPDGVDTGFRPERMPGMDIVDIDSAIETIKQSAEKQETSKKAKQEQKQALVEAIQEAAGMVPEGTGE